MFSQIIQIFSETFKTVLTAFFELLPLVKELSDLNTNMIISILGIPAILFLAAKIVITMIRLLRG